MTVNDLLRHLSRELDQDSASPVADAKYLLAKALGVTPGMLLARAYVDVDNATRSQVETWLERRKKGEPIAYILESAGFWTFELEVNPATLIPRPESELFIEYILENVDQAVCQCADWGTGSGAIAIALALEKPSWTIFASDLSKQALLTASKNAACLDAEVQFWLSDWGAAYANSSLDIIVSNPPYIRDNDEHLGQGDLRFEPRSALASGADGLDAIRQLIKDATRCLKPGGLLLIEHGFDQGAAVQILLQQNGFKKTQQLKDLAGHDRISLGSLK